jgi:beta-N-acetylhexosaminidase
MGPVRHAIGGTRRAGRDALNAGVDLLLISYDSDQYWEVMDGLLAASRAGTLDRGQLERSEERLRTALENRWLVDLHTGSVECAVHQVCK